MVFEPFFRLARDEHSGVEGNGLGLAICRELVAQLEGEIALSSVVGQGTSVTVRFPARGSHDRTGRSSAPVEAEGVRRSNGFCQRTRTRRRRSPRRSGPISAGPCSRLDDRAVVEAKADLDRPPSPRPVAAGAVPRRPVLVRSIALRRGRAELAGDLGDRGLSTLAVRLTRGEGPGTHRSPSNDRARLLGASRSPFVRVQPPVAQQVAGVVQPGRQLAVVLLLLDQPILDRRFSRRSLARSRFIWAFSYSRWVKLVFSWPTVGPPERNVGRPEQPGAASDRWQPGRRGRPPSPAGGVGGRSPARPEDPGRVGVAAGALVRVTRLGPDRVDSG